MNPNTIKNKVIVYCNKSINNSNSFYDSINNQYLSLSSYEILFKDKYYELPTKESRIEISSNIVPFDSPACFLSLKLNLTDNVCIMQIPGYVSVRYSYIYKKFILLTRYGEVESRVLTEEEVKYLFTSKSDIIKSSVKNAIINNELFKKYCIPIEEE